MAAIYNSASVLYAVFYITENFSSLKFIFPPKTSLTDAEFPHNETGNYQKASRTLCALDTVVAVVVFTKWEENIKNTDIA